MKKENRVYRVTLQYNHERTISIGPDLGPVKEAITSFPGRQVRNVVFLRMEPV